MISNIWNVHFCPRVRKPDSQGRDRDSLLVIVGQKVHHPAPLICPLVPHSQWQACASLSSQYLVRRPDVRGLVAVWRCQSLTALPVAAVMFQSGQVRQCWLVKTQYPSWCTRSPEGCWLGMASPAGAHPIRFHLQTVSQNPPKILIFSLVKPLSGTA